MANENFRRAKAILLEAVDTVIEAATTPQAHPSQAQVPRRSQAEALRPSQAEAPRPSQAQGPRHSTSWPSSSHHLVPPTGRSSSSPSLSIDEHRRVFGYKPLKGKGPSKGKGRARAANATKPWRKDCICLRDCEQAWKPSSEEKIELARIGLGLRNNVTFINNGDAQHVHEVVLKEFPVLIECGGYTLLRLAENSHSMVEIEGPDNGVTVQYLKDILNQAKLYIRPLQKDITQEDMKPYSTPEV